jgi:hypothetical protein
VKIFLISTFLFSFTLPAALEEIEIGIPASTKLLAILPAGVSNSLTFILTVLFPLS